MINVGGERVMRELDAAIALPTRAEDCMTGVEAVDRDTAGAGLVTNRRQLAVQSETLMVT